MQKVTYLHCGSGVAGDMLIGALVDLGLSVAELERTLKQVSGLRDWRLKVEKTERQLWPARSLTVVGDRPFGSGAKMRKAVSRSRLPLSVKQRARRILERLEWAEAQAHGGHGDHFHPQGLGLLDTVVDVVGVSWGLWKLGIENVSSSAVNAGRIAPAAAHLIRRFRIPVLAESFPHELATPTGIAILSEIATVYGAMPTLTLARSGFGAGQRDHAGRPNVLSLYVGSSPSGTVGWMSEGIVQLETLMDDMDPRLYPYVSDLLFARGALDVWWVSAGMKKGRPGTVLHALCRPAQEQELLRILFEETPTLGIRRLPLDRWVLPRQQQGFRKVARLSHGQKKVSVEFEAARERALRDGTPLRKLLK